MDQIEQRRGFIMGSIQFWSINYEAEEKIVLAAVERDLLGGKQDNGGQRN
jgi:hypothetical protein